MQDVARITKLLDQTVEPYLVRDEHGNPVESFGYLRRGARDLLSGAVKGWPHIEQDLVAWHILHEMPPDFENTRTIIICTPPIHEDDAQLHPSGFHLLTDESLGDLDYATDDVTDLLAKLRGCMDMLARKE